MIGTCASFIMQVQKFGGGGQKTCKISDSCDTTSVSRSGLKSSPHLPTRVTCGQPSTVYLVVVTGRATELVLMNYRGSSRTRWNGSGPCTTFGSSLPTYSPVPPGVLFTEFMSVSLDDVALAAAVSGLPDKSSALDPIPVPVL